MKTIKILLLSALFAVNLFSCQDDDTDQDQPELTEDTITPKRNEKTFQGNFILKDHIIDQGILDDDLKLRVLMEGNGEMDQMGDAQLELYHHRVLKPVENHVRISDGDFKIWDSLGSEIYGTVNESLDEYSPRYELTGNVHGGTGKFQGASGKFVIQLVKTGHSRHRAVVRLNIHNLDPVWPAL